MRPADTIQVSAGLFVPLYAQPTRLATLHSEFPKAREYNSICIVRSQRKGTWYLYLVNIWATWCTHCVRELPELERMSKEWAEQDCQIIGICDDATDDEMAAEAIKILEKNGVTYRNIRSTDELKELLKFTSLPTSYYVDSEGVVLDYPIKGAQIEVYPEKLQELLSNME